MSAGRVDAAGESHNLDLLVALEIVVPVLLNRVGVGDESAVSVGVDIGAPGALGELAGVGGLLRPGLRSATENVAWVDAEQQRNDQNDQAGAAADRDLPATSSSSAAHLRRVEFGTLFVFHVSPTPGNSDARLDRQHSGSLGPDLCEMPRWQSQAAARVQILMDRSYPFLRPATAHHPHRCQLGAAPLAQLAT